MNFMMGENYFRYGLLMDSLLIDRLELWTRIGVPKEERKQEQCVLVNVELFTDLSAIAKKDDVKKGIDYDLVVKDIRKLATTERKTIERLAEDIAAMILKKYRPYAVEVSVEKRPIPGVESVIVTLSRQRAHGGAPRAARG